MLWTMHCGGARMARDIDSMGRLLCHRCMDRGRHRLADGKVPASKPGYVHYMCLEHIRKWYWRRRRAARREADRRHLTRRR